ncbi:MAG: LysR family transcriptional regulator, partial [Clostridia bacterium]
MIDSKLATLITLCEVKNYTKTAEIMSLTQPAVSHQIQLLEDEYNIKIFNRDGKKLILTQEGKVLLKFANRIQAMYQNLAQAIIDSKKNIRRISVGITHSAASTIIPEVLATYSAKKEDVTINILVDDINIIYTNLKNYKIDLAIIDGITTSEKINSILLDTDYLVCIVPNSSPLAKKPVIQIDEIKREKLI